ncbi:MAG: hypothetical protein ACTSR2_01435 [Candidatus Hodarchaeales archaeon]
MAVYKYYEWEIPEYMRGSIERYLEQGIRPGDFLYYVLCNNFAMAVAYADRENIRNLPAYAYWLMNELPMDAWGSKEKVEAWCVKARYLYESGKLDERNEILGRD